MFLLLLFFFCFFLFFFFFFLMIRRPPRSTLFPLHDALPILSRIVLRKRTECKAVSRRREEAEARAEPRSRNRARRAFNRRGIEGTGLSQCGRRCATYREEESESYHNIPRKGATGPSV